MALDLHADGTQLDAVEDWIAGDSHTFAFTVTLSDGSAKDISEDTIEWELLERAYHSREDAVVTDGDTDVEVVTSGTVDPTAGEFEVRVAEDVTSEDWGRYVQRVTVDPLGDSRQSWIGEILLSD